MHILVSNDDGYRSEGIVRLRAFGNYSYRIADPKLFHTEISGTRESYTTADIDGQLRGLVLQNISNAVASRWVVVVMGGDIAEGRNRLPICKPGRADRR